MRAKAKRTLGGMALLLGLTSCSMYTSITREDDGNYVITGANGGKGFVMTCSYDPETMTLTVLKKDPK